MALRDETQILSIDLADDPDAHVGREVSLTIVEDLVGSDTRGDLRVDLPEHPYCALALAVPGGHPPEPRCSTTAFVSSSKK